MKGNLKQRILALFLALCLFVGLMPGAAWAADVVDSGTCGENLTWVLDSEGMLTIEGEGEMDDYNGGDAPWYSYGESTLNVMIGDGVTSIGDYAFCGCSSLTSVTIPASVISIGWNAFCECSSLTSVTIPASVISIGLDAFSDCASLKGIWVDENNPNYSSDACGVLFNKSKTELIRAPGAIAGAYATPDSVTGIRGSAFHGCTSLTSVTIPDSVTSIGNYAFHGCTSLTSITIPGGVTSIGHGAFSYCDSLTGIWVDANNSYYSSDSYGVLFNKDKTELIQAPGVIAGAYAIPDSVTGIGDWAFEDCPSLTSVTIPNGVTSIGTGAFDGCSSLTGIVIPDSVTSIGDGAFEDCSSLTSVTIPNGVTSIKFATFCGCSSLTAVIIGNSVTSIGDSAFEDCSSLTSVTIPDGVTSIGDSAFEYCTSLTSITIPDSVTYIGDWAFGWCSSLTSVMIPKSVTNIGERVFAWCSSLTGIQTHEDNPNYSSDSSGVLFNKDKTVLIQAPGALTGAYAIPESVIGIGDCGFSGCYGLTDITIPESVTNIGTYAFGECSSLTSVIIMESVTNIGYRAFSYCSELMGVWVHQDNPCYSSDSSGVLFNKDKTTLIQVPGALTGAYVIPESVISIGSFAFSACYSLNSVTIPESVTSIESVAFSQCANLTSVVFIGNAPLIKSRVFSKTTATAYYPENNPTWTADVMQDYGGTITWTAYAPGTEPWNNPFTDVPESKYYYAPVLWAYENGITTGTSATAFSPEKECTRGQIVTFLWRAAGEPEPTTTNNPFTDVDSDDYFYKAVLWAVEKGITNGASATTFNPKGACNRAQVVTFMWRAAGEPTPTSANNPFVDVPADKYYRDAVLWAVEREITNGTSPTKFSPNNICNRGQIVTFLYRGYAE